MIAKVPVVWSQRLLRKGSFVEETYGLFSRWDFAQDIESNLTAGLHGRFNTSGWEKEVRATTHGRVRHFSGITPLIWMARNGMRFSDWVDCYRLWLVLTEQPFGSFVMEWLNDERDAGRFQVRVEDVMPFVHDTWRREGKAPLSEYGKVRAGRDLIKMAAELGLVTGTGPAKAFMTPGLSDPAFLFHAHLIAEIEGTNAKVVDSKLWRASFLKPAEVHQSLLRLHQYRKLDYQVAGSLVQLTLPCASVLDFALTVSS
jgi:hypothetical protein